MANYTQHEAAKEIRAIAKKNGLVFKKQDTVVNKRSGERYTLWMFTNRITGHKIAGSMRFWDAYSNCLSGYIDTLKQGATI